MNEWEVIARGIEKMEKKQDQQGLILERLASNHEHLDRLVTDLKTELKAHKTSAWLRITALEKADAKQEGKEEVKEKEEAKGEDNKKRLLESDLMKWILFGGAGVGGGASASVFQDIIANLFGG